MHEYPALKWHPETGECRQFAKADDVPEGWLDTHPVNVKNAATVAAGKLPDITRQEIIAHLEAGHVEYNKAHSAKQLHKLLTTEVHATLKGLGREFDPEADVRSLIQQLGPPSA